jgi:hypothetical protein
MMARSRAALIHRRHCNCAKLRMSVFRSLARGFNLMVIGKSPSK